MCLLHLTELQNYSLRKSAKACKNKDLELKREKRETVNAQHQVIKIGRYIYSPHFGYIFFNKYAKIDSLSVTACQHLNLG